MKKENKDFLDQHRDAINEITGAQTAKKANAIKGDLIRILREEFIPGYVFVPDCGTCVFDMTKLLYQRYDKWLADNPEAVILPEPIAEVVAKPKNHKRK